MDYGTIGSIFTVAVFVFFIGIVAWAYSSRSKAGFDEAANLVFDDEPQKNSTKIRASNTQRESSSNE